MAILQVRNMDDKLYALLRRQAENEHRSISHEVISLLKRALAQPAASRGQNATDAFLDMAGNWGDRRSAKDIAGEIRSARRFGRRFAPEGP